ncbi:hypothetical protein BDB00DRAFT_829579 [Zychaea mexicana]|uniref:uncharacterized protein n=1 Tax=Zychaea mexicana TaxID=64656 RepID=UPI0022FDC916|nr:uncharacterized protein BDB00DRAFT_829579 [Zychaea mexicana]KAI9492184.1 hypothetical protein BDB00DRAFT_829579 [Zychaea mexicana]
MQAPKANCWRARETMLRPSFQSTKQKVCFAICVLYAKSIYSLYDNTLLILKHLLYVSNHCCCYRSYVVYNDNISTDRNMYAHSSSALSFRIYISLILYV